MANNTNISFIGQAATILGDGTVDGQLKIIACQDVDATCDVDFIDSEGVVATTTFGAVGESVSCVWNDTTEKWNIIAYGTGDADDNLVGSQDNT